MKKLYILFFTILISFLSFGQASDLYFSMYGEGSSNNKFLEIYNGTGSDVDLSTYSISTCSNGCDLAGEFDYPDTITFAPGTILADGDVYIIAHPSADASILAVADQTFTFLSNGDDSTALTMVGATASTYTIIDIIGDLSTSGGPWDVAGVASATANHTLTRKSSICDPNPNELGSFGTDADTSEWIVGASDSGWGDLGSYTGCVSSPTITITAPSDTQEFASGTTNVDIEWTSANTTGSETVNITVNGSTTNDVTSPFSVVTTDGQTYNVTIELVDGSVLDSDTVSFSVIYPCELQVGTITKTCDAITSGNTDTYNVTIDFTGGNTSQYTIDTGGVGTVGGDNPTDAASGTITITGITEGTDFVVTFTGDAGNSSCDFTRNINSPNCNPIDALPIYENFDYGGSAGNLTTVSGGKWVNHSGSTSVLYATSSLSMGSYPSSGVGGSATITGTNSEDVNRLFAVQSSGVVYMSALVNISAVSTGNYFMHLKDGGNNFMARVSAKDDGSGKILFGIATSSTLVYGTTPFDLNTIYLVVASYNIDNGTSNLYVLSSPPATEPVTPEATDSGTSGTLISAVALRQSSNIPTAIVDGIQVGTSWSSAVLSTKNAQIDGFSFSPNPTSLGYVKITSKSQSVMKVGVFDILGKQVVNTTVSNNRLDVSKLNTGIYIMKISQDDATTTKKLVIK